MSTGQWEKQYGKTGKIYIERICEYVEMLKPLICEIGWDVLELNSGEDTKITIEYKKAGSQPDEEESQLDY